MAFYKAKTDMKKGNKLVKCYSLLLKIYEKTEEKND